MRRARAAAASRAPRALTLFFPCGDREDPSFRQLRKRNSAGGAAERERRRTVKKAKERAKRNRKKLVRPRVSFFPLLFRERDKRERQRHCFFVSGRMLLFTDWLKRSWRAKKRKEKGGPLSPSALLPAKELRRCCCCQERKLISSFPLRLRRQGGGAIPGCSPHPQAGAEKEEEFRGSPLYSSKLLALFSWRCCFAVVLFSGGGGGREGGIK